MWRLTERRAGRFSLLALICVGILIAAGLAVGVVSDRADRQRAVREAGSQADLLASAVSGALAFDDQAAAQDYVDAVQVNPSVVRAVVYRLDGAPLAAFDRSGGRASRLTEVGASVRARDGRLYVTRPVVQGGQNLGAVEIVTNMTPPIDRMMRNAGLVLILALAVLVVVILSMAQAALRNANALLKQEMDERSKAEAALRESQKMEAIGRLTGGIAHDFNNLLMVASSGVELLERTDDPARRKKLSDGVRQAVERGSALTRQLLAFSRKSPLKPEVLDLGARIRGMEVLLDRSLREDIRVELDLPETLGRVEVDAGELELALLNLAVNARDAMPEGGLLCIAGRNIEAADDGAGQVRLTISDTGQGMAPEVVARVFEPFFTTKEVGRGTGLGLSQVYGFARSSGGDVLIDSEPGKGAAISIILPRSHKAVTAPIVSPASPVKGAGKVLLVEDDDAVAASVGMMLRDLGYGYVRRQTGEAALDLLRTDDRFDLVFSDMVMPGKVDGLALAKASSSAWPDLPVLLTSGYSEAAATARQAGFSILTKPYNTVDLSEALAGVLGPRPRKTRRTRKANGGG